MVADMEVTNKLTIENLLIKKIQENESLMRKNLSTLIYSDDAVSYKPEKQTFWRKAKNIGSIVKWRIFNAWDALCGRLDYDY